MATNTTEPVDDQDLLLIESLAAGHSHQQAADHAGCSSKTVQRRLKNPAFAHALRERRASRLAEFTMSLEASAATALEILDELMHSGKDTVRLAAVRIALTEHIKYRTASEHEERLLELEALAAEVSAN